MYPIVNKKDVAVIKYYSKSPPIAENENKIQ